MNSACCVADKTALASEDRFGSLEITSHKLCPSVFNSKGATIKQMLVFLGFSIVPCQNVTPCVVGGVVTFLVYKELLERWKQTIAPLKDWGTLVDWHFTRLRKEYALSYAQMKIAVLQIELLHRTHMYTLKHAHTLQEMLFGRQYY